MVVHAHTRAFALALLVALAIACGAAGGGVPDGDTSDAGSDAAPAARARLDNVDVLFVVERGAGALDLASASALAAAMPAFGRVLTTGDVDADGHEDRASLHARIGVITTDMGSGGFLTPSCDEPQFGDDARLRTTAVSARMCPSAYPPFLTLVEPGDIDTGAIAGCLLAQGHGCGWEQPLEAMLKAVTSSASPLRFQEGTMGHGPPGGANADFFRGDALLAIIVITSADDLSASDPALYDLDSTRYRGTPSARVAYHPNALHPIARYVDGLLAARDDDASTLLFAAIAGVPTNLVDAGATDYAAILADPSMQTTPDVVPERGAVGASCTTPSNAYPPRRIVETARALQSRSVATRIESLCQDDFSPPLRRIAVAILDAVEAPF